ncbi:MAG: hypothetical protein GYB67_16325 [Chloroflexi bacterium]|nr:hypothetical protein [Chloroflexota bacterium]
MTTRLLLASVGAGKTETAQAVLVTLKRVQPLAQVWVLLATERQIVSFRERLIAHERVYGNVQFFNFYSLYRRLLANARQPQRVLDDTARYGLIRTVLTNLSAAGLIKRYAPIADLPGFVRVLADFIYELKQNLITPDEFESAAQSVKEQELARIYRGYQAILREYNLVDREGEGWLALRALRQYPELGCAVDLLVVDGYDQFNVLQTQLLTLLADRAQEALITLTTVPGRTATIGRRFTRALQRMDAAAHAEGVRLTRHPGVGDFQDARHPALRHLAEQIFRPNPKTRPAEADTSGGVQFIEAPDPAAEVGAVLRRIKRRLLDGARPDDMLIAVRDWPGYSGHLSAQGRVYDLPLALHYGEPLLENPAIAALFDLLALHETDFRRRDLLDVLRSPYFAVPGMDAAQVELLERVSLDLLVTGGRAAWLAAIGTAVEAASQTTLTPARANDEDDEPDEAAAPLDADSLKTLLVALTRFFDAVTPPSTSTMAGFIRWIEDLIGPDDALDPEAATDETLPAPAYTLALPAQIRASIDPVEDNAIIARDLAAVTEFKLVLRRLLSAQALFTALDQTPRRTRWADFLADLQAAVTDAAIQRSLGRDGRVLVTSVTDARGLPHPHVFVLGLSEGVFPAPIPEDPLFLDSERRALSARGIVLPTQAERTDDDGLFFELISLARRSLTLSRPYVQNGAPWSESHLWRAACAVFTDVTPERLAIGAVVPAESVVTPHEVALAVADGLSGGDSLHGPLFAWLNERHGDLWARIKRARAIELRRLTRGPADRYSGRLSDPTLIEAVAERLGPGRKWSASQLNEYGQCAFRFFARRLLALDAFAEPEDGLDIMQFGTINHEILEATYRRLADMGVTITPEHADQAVATLREIAEPLLASAPQRLHFRAGPLWEQDRALLLRQLENLVRLDFAADNPIAKQFGAAVRRPYWLEADFSKMALTLDDGLVIRVHGIIDRIDRIGAGALVMDYKTGSTQIDSAEAARGRNFQMILYLLAAEQLLKRLDDPDAPDGIEGGIFWHISSGKLVGVLRPDADAEAINAARAHLTRYLQRGRGGDFTVHANKIESGRCIHFCEYHQLCRMAVTQRAKS